MLRKISSGSSYVPLASVSKLLWVQMVWILVSQEVKILWLNLYGFFAVEGSFSFFSVDSPSACQGFTPFPGLALVVAQPPQEQIWGDPRSCSADGQPCHSNALRLCYRSEIRRDLGQTLSGVGPSRLLPSLTVQGCADAIVCTSRFRYRSSLLSYKTIQAQSTYAPFFSRDSGRGACSQPQILHAQ